MLTKVTSISLTLFMSGRVRAGINRVIRSRDDFSFEDLVYHLRFRRTGAPSNDWEVITESPVETWTADTLGSWGQGMVTDVVSGGGREFHPPVIPRALHRPQNTEFKLKDYLGCVGMSLVDVERCGISMALGFGEPTEAQIEDRDSVLRSVWYDTRTFCRVIRMGDDAGNILRETNVSHAFIQARYRGPDDAKYLIGFSGLKAVVDAGEASEGELTSLIDRLMSDYGLEFHIRHHPGLVTEALIILLDCHIQTTDRLKSEYERGLSANPMLRDFSQRVSVLKGEAGPPQQQSEDDPGDELATSLKVISWVSQWALNYLGYAFEASVLKILHIALAMPGSSRQFQLPAEVKTQYFSLTKAQLAQQIVAYQAARAQMQTWPMTMSVSASIDLLDAQIREMETVLDFKNSLSPGEWGEGGMGAPGDQGGDSGEGQSERDGAPDDSSNDMPDMDDRDQGGPGGDDWSGGGGAGPGNDEASNDRDDDRGHDRDDGPEDGGGVDIPGPSGKKTPRK